MNSELKKIICFFYSLYFIFSAQAQIDSTKVITIDSILHSSTFNKNKVASVIGSESILYGSSLYGLNELWYKDFPHSNFHFFNDTKEWMQMDKCGHLTTSYYVGRVGIGLMKWSGVERKKAIWYGGILGSLYLNTVEVLDGFSSEWGFSVGDLVANSIGTFACIAQQLKWDEQRIVLKFSYLNSDYAAYRPNVLGRNLQEKILKDYNAQTYWLSINIASFLKKETRFPKYLNIAVGYGAKGMTGAFTNPQFIDADGNQHYFERYRMYSLSLDLDLTRIKTKSKFVNTIFNTIGFLKFPFPSIEFSNFGVHANWLGL